VQSGALKRREMFGTVEFLLQWAMYGCWPVAILERKTVMLTGGNLATASQSHC
jgi:hypothetical protein